MRIRSIHPSFADSDDIASLEEPVQLHYVKLWLYADDEGRGRDDVRRLRADLYRLQAAIDEPEVERRQAALASAGLIHRYRGGDGKAYFAIPSFSEWQSPQKPKASKYPAPPVRPGCETLTAPDESDTATVRVSYPYDTRIVPVPSGKEGRGEGRGEGGEPSRVTRAAGGSVPLELVVIPADSSAPPAPPVDAEAPADPPPVPARTRRRAAATAKEGVGGAAKGDRSYPHYPPDARKEDHKWWSQLVGAIEFWEFVGLMARVYNLEQSAYGARPPRRLVYGAMLAFSDAREAENLREQRWWRLGDFVERWATWRAAAVAEMEAEEAEQLAAGGAR